MGWKEDHALDEHGDLSGSSGLVPAGGEPDMTRLAEELVASATELRSAP